MISDKGFTKEEFDTKVKEYAQAVANRTDGEVTLRSDPIQRGAYIVSIVKGRQSQHTQLAHSNPVNGRVTMTNVFGEVDA